MHLPQVMDRAYTGLLGAYQCPDGVYDELHDMGGFTRDYWAQFFQKLEKFNPDQLTERWSSGRRILRNHGVTYNVAAQEGTSERPWELDMAPFLLDAREWTQIERGVIQRAHLHNLILQDIYTGPQFLLRNGLIPPALLFANPNFLRNCRGIRTPGDLYLHLHAVDLARAPDGNWWVLDDRMQSPNGLGYTLENRTIIGRILQDVFRETGVERLKHFFDGFRESLMNLAPSSTTWPRVVMLTPGVHSIAHYEHSLLARYLGFTLVEGADLSVRDNKVYLKTVEGPQRVNAIVRRVNDLFCDPVELRADSFLGVPGLVQAARSGNVLIANALGSAVVETPALQASLPELSRHILGEDLYLKSASTWWCGEVQERDHVLDNLENIIVKSAFPTGQRQTRSGAELSKMERDELRAMIQKRPHEYIGQSPVPLSCAPVWTNDRFESRPIMLRVYVAASGDTFRVLPGGLTKVSNSSLSPLRGLQLSGGSKDTWIVGGTNYDSAHASITLESRPAERLQSGVPSRIADIFFWLGRYAERLENLSQLLRCLITRLSDEPEPRKRLQTELLAKVLVEFGFKLKRGKNNIERTILDVSYSPKSAGGIFDLCSRIGSITTSVRDRFSGDAWRVLNKIRDFPGKQPAFLPLGGLQSLIHEIMTTLAALTGLEAENMTRGHEWHFLEIGRRLERSQNLCRLLQSVFNQPNSGKLHLNPLLEICDSSMTYRRRYYSEPELATVLDTLLLDASNPRSLCYNLNLMKHLVSALPKDSKDSNAHIEEQMIQEISATLDNQLIGRVNALLKSNRRKAATEPFRQVFEHLRTVSESLTQRYFSLIKSSPYHDFSPIQNPS